MGNDLPKDTRARCVREELEDSSILVPEYLPSLGYLLSPGYLGLGLPGVAHPQWSCPCLLRGR
jgi:hypothetical protein